MYEKIVEKIDFVKERKFPIESGSYLSGVLQDLESQITSGMIFRIIPLFIILDDKEQDEISDNISDIINDKIQTSDNLIEIQKYHKRLLDIQYSEDKEINPIDNFKIDSELNKKLIGSWKLLKKKVNEQMGIEDSKGILWTREMLRGFAYMCNSAFLNVFDREIVKKDGLNYLCPNKQDFDLAIKLMNQELIVKSNILAIDKFVKRIKSFKVLEQIAQSEKLNKLTKTLLNTLANSKKEKI